MAILTKPDGKYLRLKDYRVEDGLLTIEYLVYPSGSERGREKAIESAGGEALFSAAQTQVDAAYQAILTEAERLGLTPEALAPDGKNPSLDYPALCEKKRVYDRLYVSLIYAKQLYEIGYSSLDAQDADTAWLASVGLDTDKLKKPDTGYQSITYYLEDAAVVTSPQQAYDYLKTKLVCGYENI